MITCLSIRISNLQRPGVNQKFLQIQIPFSKARLSDEPRRLPQEHLEAAAGRGTQDVDSAEGAVQTVGAEALRCSSCPMPNVHVRHSRRGQPGRQFRWRFHRQPWRRDSALSTHARGGMPTAYTVVVRVVISCVTVASPSARPVSTRDLVATTPLIRRAPGDSA